jgi:hypothetical protein
VGRTESGGRLDDQRDCLLRRHLALALDARGERLPAQQLHHQIRDAVLRDAGVEDLDDVGVADGVGRTRFVDETRERLLVVAQLGPQHFDRHLAADAGVFSEIHRAHSTLAEESGGAVVAEALADHGAGVYRLL